MNLVCKHHESSLSVAGLSGSLLNYLSYWSFANNFMNNSRSSGTLGWKLTNFMNITFVIQEHSWIVYEHI